MSFPLSTQVVDGIPLSGVEEVEKYRKQLRIVDVRKPEEFHGELSHIPGAELVPLGEDLTDFLKSQDDFEQNLVFVCRSGGRSGRATLEALEMGFQNVANMQGGMLRWNEQELPVE